MISSAISNMVSGQNIAVKPSLSVSPRKLQDQQTDDIWTSAKHLIKSTITNFTLNYTD
jgi:hypothetical protein